MQRRLPRNALFVATPGAIALMAACKSRPRNREGATSRTRPRGISHAGPGRSHRQPHATRGHGAAAVGQRRRQVDCLHAPRPAAPPAPAQDGLRRRWPVTAISRSRRHRSSPNRPTPRNTPSAPTTRCIAPASNRSPPSRSTSTPAATATCAACCARACARRPTRCAPRNSSTTSATGIRRPPSRNVPFRVTTELAPAPWNAQRQLLMVGIKGYDVPKADAAAGQPGVPDRHLRLDGFAGQAAAAEAGLLACWCRSCARRTACRIVVYAGSAGLVLPPTPGDRHEEILAALDRLQAGGSTNGGDGIQLAYAMAKQAFIEGGVNRVILATDGDFNVGTVSQEALETLVGDQRKSGIALTTLGFGQGNYNDAMAERLADVGDGNHAYIDTPQEARKVLVEEMQATLLTIARDVKIQVEFNPALVVRVPPDRLREPPAAPRGFRQRQGRCRRDRRGPRSHRAVRDHPGRLRRRSPACAALRQGASTARRWHRRRTRPPAPALQAARRGQPAG